MQHTTLAPSPSRLAPLPPGLVVLASALAVALACAWAAQGTMGLGVPVLWPATGLGFALLCTQGRAGFWGLVSGLAAWSAWHHGPTWNGLACVAAGMAGPWVVWRRVQVSFAGRSQPFARQATVLAFLQAQVALGAPLSALLLVAGAWLAGAQHTPAQWVALAGLHTLGHAAGGVLLAPVAWEVLVARARGGLGRFGHKLGQVLRTDPGTPLVLLALAAATGGLMWLQQPALARASVLLMLPVLAWQAMRASPVGVHVSHALVGCAVLASSAWALARQGHSGSPPTGELWLVTLAVVVGLASTQLLMVTAHERRLALKRLERQADTDPLTNLLSLAGLYRSIEALSERLGDAGETQFPDETPSAQQPALVSVHMTNADSIEQLLGTRQSDTIERATSGALTSTAPQVTWARVSKAHFVGLLPESDRSLPDLLAQLNVAAVESRALLDDTLGRPQWTVAAVTLAAQPPPPVEVIMACLRRTEQEAQAARQALVGVVDRASAQALRAEAEQAERIRQTIQQKQLVLFAQPIVANHQPEALPHKYEVLVRLHDGQGGTVAPAVFLPVAMRNGLMQLLDMAVVDQTFEWFATHPAALQRLSHCAINLSGPTVASPTVAQRVAQALAQHGLPPHKFTFEITESQAIANLNQATDTIQALRACGCRVAIDDFGTGVATFDYLKRFDVDYIKIDGAFIQTLIDSPVDRVIVESIVKVAHQLKVRTVAEFVSSPELKAAVTALGVDESQGFVVGAPQPLHVWFGEPG